MNKEKLLELINAMPNGMKVSVYIESIDSAVDIVDVEVYCGEIHIRVDY